MVGPICLILISADSETILEPPAGCRNLREVVHIVSLSNEKGIILNWVDFETQPSATEALRPVHGPPTVIASRRRRHLVFIGGTAPSLRSSQ